MQIRAAAFSSPWSPRPRLSPGFSIKFTLFARETSHFGRAFRAHLPPHPFRLPPLRRVCSSIEVRHWLVIFHCRPVTVMGNATQKKQPGPGPGSGLDLGPKSKCTHIFLGHHLFDSLDKSGQWVSSVSLSIWILIWVPNTYYNRDLVILSILYFKSHIIF